MQIAGDCGELVGAARVLVCTFTMEPQTSDLPVPNRECVDHGSRRMRCIIWGDEPIGQENVQVPEGSLQGQSIRQCRDRESRAQLDQCSAPSQVEGALRTSRDRDQKTKTVAGNDGAQPRTLADNVGNLGDSLQARHQR